MSKFVLFFTYGGLDKADAPKFQGFYLYNDVC